MARSLNRVQLIGNLTRDPELRYTPQGSAVCTFGLATNRSWTTDGGEKKEDTEFHRIVAWNKLAELCSQLLTKGRKVYVEGRISSRSWTGQDGAQRNTTEIVIEDMIILDSKRGSEGGFEEEIPMPAEESHVEAAETPKAAKKEKEVKTEEVSEDINPDDIPF
ncbi:MAG: single-stranded DNA-binding protein [Candidatus Levyibacteriota bacterium]